jgi:hypothetical protein
MKVLIMMEFNGWVEGSAGEELKFFKETANWFEKHRESGKCQGYYGNAVTGGIVSIWDVEQLDEVMRVGFTCPFKQYVKVTTYPLLDPAFILSQAEQALK